MSIIEIRSRFKGQKSNLRFWELQIDPMLEMEMAFHHRQTSGFNVGNRHKILKAERKTIPIEL